MCLQLTARQGQNNKGDNSTLNGKRIRLAYVLRVKTEDGTKERPGQLRTAYLKCGLICMPIGVICLIYLRASEVFRTRTKEIACRRRNSKYSLENNSFATFLPWPNRLAVSTAFNN
jgi:hypothetical protein